MVRIEKRILSPTAINTYLACPRKYYLRYIERRPGKQSIHLVRGLIVHDTLYRFYKDNPEVPKQFPIGLIREKLLKAFNERWEKAKGQLLSLGLSDQELQYYHDDSELMLFNFSHWFYSHGMLSPDLSETKIFSMNLRLMGVIDAVITKGDEIILVDYKTSKSAEITSDIQRQAALYAILFFDRYKRIPDAVWIHFLKFLEEPVTINIDEQLMEYGRITLESVHNKTQSRNESDYPCTCGGYCEREFEGGANGDG